MAKGSSFAELPVAGKAFVGILIVIVLSVLSYALVFSSISGEIEEAENRFKTMEADLNKAKKEKREYLTLKATLTEREPIDRKNKRSLPKRAEIASVLQDLNRLAEINGLKIRLVEPRPEETETMYTRIPVSLGISGRYHQVAKFFHDVSQLDRAINMENVHLKEPEVLGEEVKLDVDVMATTFRHKEEAPADAKAAEGAPGKKG